MSGLSRLRLPAALLPLPGACAPLFSQPVGEHAQVVLAGAMLATGTRTGTACWRVMGLSQEPCGVNYHRVWHRAPWALLRAQQRSITRWPYSTVAVTGPHVERVRTPRSFPCDLWHCTGCKFCKSLEPFEIIRENDGREVRVAKACEPHNIAIRSIPGPHCAMTSHVFF
jgi:hypothetical protein